MASVGPSVVHDRMKNIHCHETRASNNGFHISGDDIHGSFSYFGKKEWNTLPDNLKALEKIDLFKVKLKQYLMRDY